jgi:hypothetical protein
MLSPSIEDKGGKSLVEMLTNMVSEYLVITVPILRSNSKPSEQLRKQGTALAIELTDLVSRIELRSPETLKHISPSSSCDLSSPVNGMTVDKSRSIKFHSPTSLGSPSSVIEDSTPFIKKIENLEEEKMRLENIISHHKTANIKMLIKLNEGES